MAAWPLLSRHRSSPRLARVTARPRSSCSPRRPPAPPPLLRPCEAGQPQIRLGARGRPRSSCRDPRPGGRVHGRAARSLPLPSCQEGAADQEVLTLSCLANAAGRPHVQVSEGEHPLTFSQAQFSGTFSDPRIFMGGIRSM